MPDTKEEQENAVYYAHTRDDGEKQTILEHAEGTAKIAERSLPPEDRPRARACGLLHDAGKYQPSFQDKLNGKELQIEHAGCGAQAAMELPWPDSEKALLAYCIAGHHSGLPDGGTAADSQENPTLFARFKRKYEPFSKYREELSLPEPPAPDTGEGWGNRLAFRIRMAYSALTDADYLDTERFVKGEAPRAWTADFHALDAAVDTYIAELQAKAADTPLNRERTRLRLQALEAVDAPEHLFFMDMLTGSGKTLASLSYALKRLLARKKRRIIYVIPFTTVIEQTALELERAFGQNVVLQHHSNFDFEEAEKKAEKEGRAEEGVRLGLAAENWDAPVIITTNVQFFESVYGNRSSTSRKLHNMADSVIVFDEAHMMPVELFTPCLDAVRNLTELYGCDAIFLSATMPDFSEQFEKLTKREASIRCLTPNINRSVFERYKIEYLGKVSAERITEEAERHKSLLIVVNARKTARRLFEMLAGNKYHLSTYMTPEHRESVVKLIREDLKQNRQVTVVSTSLIEAGVDLDFECVCREIAGVDSVLQAAGRCNRNGRNPCGEVYVFELADTPISMKNQQLRTKAAITRQMLSKGTLLSESAPVKYFRELYRCCEREMKEFTFWRGVSIQKWNGVQIPSFPFATYARQFRMIEDRTVGVIVKRDEKACALVEQLEFGGLTVRRQLQRYTATVTPSERKILESLGVLHVVGSCFVLEGAMYYNAFTGICFDTDEVYCF